MNVEYIEAKIREYEDKMRSFDVSKIRNTWVNVIAWFLIAVAMIISTLMSNFVGWSTIQGLLLELFVLVLLKYLLTYGLTRD